MAVHCPHCDRIVHKDEIDLELLIISCHACSVISELADPEALAALETTRPRASPSTIHRLEAVRRGDTTPLFFSSTRRDNTLFIRRAWPRNIGVPALVVSVLWNINVFWYMLSEFGLFNGTYSETPLWVWCFPLVFGIGGVFVLYLSLCLVLNATTITVSNESLSLSHGPLPWPGAFTVDVSQIDQLYCKELRRLGRHGYHYTYQVNMVSNDGSEQVFVSNLVVPEQALFIETHIENFLGIVDRPIRGEFNA